MTHHFYSHLIEVDGLFTELDTLDITTEEKQDLVTIVESSIHHVVIDTLLSELSEEDKKTFLSHVASNKHTEVWKLLTEKVDNVHEKIRTAVHGLKKEMHADIKETKKKGR